MPIDFDSLGDSVANAKRGFGAYLTDRSDDSITTYGETDDGGVLRARVTAKGDGATIRIQTTQPSTDSTIDLPSGADEGIVQALLSAVDAHGVLVDVDSFEGEGEAWHEEIEKFTDQVDAAFDGPPLSNLKDAPGAPEAATDGPDAGIDH
jgi:hypothetical protein